MNQEQIFESFPEKLLVDINQKGSSSILGIYQSSPTTFALQLFNAISQIHPKTLRIICYTLYSQGINLTTLYNLGVANPLLIEWEKVPSENISTLIKYQFPITLKVNPTDPELSLFFWRSYQKSFIDSEESREWLRWIYDLFRTQKLDLNFPNFVGYDENGNIIKRTLLEEAIYQGSLAHVVDLLEYQIHPAGVIDRLIFDLPYLENQLVYGLIIRQLIRYGAKTMVTSEPYLQKIYSDLPDTNLTTNEIVGLTKMVFRFIFSGTKLKPYYAPSQVLSKYDFDEDFYLLTQLQPEIVQSVNFQKEYPQLNPEAFQEQVQKENAQTQTVAGKVLTWPSYIDATTINSDRSFCPIDNSELAVATPADSVTLYRQVLSYLPDIRDKQDTQIIQSDKQITQLIDSNQPTSYLNSILSN